MAVVDYFLKIDGLAGESNDAAHKGEFEIDSFTFGVDNLTTIGSATGGAGAGKIRFSEFTVKKTTDKASPTLFLNCVQGSHYKTVTLSCRKAGGDPKSSGTEFLKIRMSDVLVSSYATAASKPPPTPPPSVQVIAVVGDTTSVGGVAGSGLPNDSLGLTFRSVQVTDSQPTRTSVPPAAGGVVSFDTKTGLVSIGQGTGTGGTVGAAGGQIMRLVQEFDVSSLIGLLTQPFGDASLHLTINGSVVNTPLPGDIIPTTLPTKPAPTHTFDVILYAPADGQLTASDLTRKGNKVARLTINGQGDPITQDVDLTEFVTGTDGTFGIRLQLRGANLPDPFDAPEGDQGGDSDPDRPSFVALFQVDVALVTS